MATAGAYTHHSSSLTPPHSSRRSVDEWEFSVPIDHHEYNYRPRTSLSSGDQVSYELHVQKTRRTDGNQRNRQGSLSTSSPQTGKRSESHHSHIGDDRQANTRHDADLSNLYNGPESYNDENNPPSWADQAEYDHDSSRWIHRDKLLEIETQELRTAGIYVLPTERIETRLEEIAREREERRKCYDSSLPPNDLRTPEEVAAELMRLKNGSKIPLSVQSPIPVPEEYKERTTPFKWTIGHHSAPGSATNGSHVRRRSHSTGSSYLLDSAPAATARTPKVTPKSKTTTSKSTHTTPQSTPRGRKNANARGRGGAMAKKRTRSNPQLYNRPKTSGSASVTSPKPSNHYTPEGVEPPWAVASYKPDPRLPPDQQIIPTVAKRLAQEKWEREGAFASVYDPKLRPLKVHDDWKNVERPPKTENEEKEEKEQTVPKEPPQSPKEVYSTVPPPAPSPPVREPKPPRMAPPIEPPRPVRVPDPEAQEPAKEKKGICCCIVM